MKDRKGITLTSLVIVIIIMLILAGVGTYTGINTVRYVKRTQFNNELKIIHARVDEIVEKKLTPEELNEYGKAIEEQTDEIKQKIQTALEGTENTGFRYFEKQDLEEIGVDGIDRQVIINFSTREVVDINGIKLDGIYIYRMEKWNPVEYQNQNTEAPTFNLSKKVYGLNATIEVTDIEYKNGITKGSIRYGEVIDGEVTLWKTGSSSITIEKSGTYRVQVIDAAGNTARKDIEIVTCNKPKLIAGMTPICYNEDTKTWDTVEETSGIWYDYAADKKQWANIKTIAKTANADGTYNEAQWVWIPRFAYQIPEKPTTTSNSDAPEFKIAFLKGTTNVPITESDLGGASIKLDTLGGVTAGDWVVHPAFTFGDQELTGIWVAKFEASSNAPNTVADGGGDTTEYQVNVKPSVPSWRSITASNMFDVCHNMTAVAGALEGMNSTDPHMMKNVEWGAVVYLAQSKHGKNGQVWNNPYYQKLGTAWNDTSVSVSDNDIILTGMAATSAGKDASNTTACDSYNSGNGPEASTTGNVYGIYDMAGGTWEYVAAYISTISNDTNTESLIVANDKYKDIYEVGATQTSQQNNYEANAGKYGDAIYETSYQGTNYASWQNDYSNFLSSGSPVFVRGGSYTNGNGAGIFAFHPDAGAVTQWFRSFRPACIAY